MARPRFMTSLWTWPSPMEQACRRSKKLGEATSNKRDDLGLTLFYFSFSRFRTVELVEDPYPDRVGTSFYFRVNGVPIWSKGSNLIPLDAFESRVNMENTRFFFFLFSSFPWVLSHVDFPVHFFSSRRLLQNSADANMNTVRIWGGGVYQNDCIYHPIVPFSVFLSPILIISFS